MRFVDTNIFIRLIAQDDPRKLKLCKEFFRRLAAGEESATTSEAIVAEVVFVLAGKTSYAMPRTTIADTLITLLSYKGFALPERDTLIQALELYALTALDFADALAAAHVLNDGLEAVLSFDKDFDKIGVPRVEP